MIEGLKFQMPSQELREHLASRIDHHRRREDFYAKKADELVAGNVEAMNMTGGNPVEALRAKGKEHANKVRLFTFMQNHVVADELYQLADTDLQRLEILETRW